MLLLKMAYSVSLRKQTLFSIFIVLSWFFPSMVLSQIFTAIPLPSNATGPESIAFDIGATRFFVSVADGRILEYTGPTGGFQDFGYTSTNRSKAVCDGTNGTDLGPVCGRPLGIAFHFATRRLYVCDAYLGLMVLSDRGRLATPVSTFAEGEPYHLCNGLDVNQLSGNVFFTDSSSVYNLRLLSQALNANDSTGRLLMYEPRTDRVSVLLRNLTAPAGAAVNLAGTYVLVSNYIGNTTIKYWLQGPRNGTYDIINTQARPDNIQRTALGDYWQAAAMVKQPTQLLVPIGVRMTDTGTVSRTVNFEPWYGNNLISEVQEFAGVLYVTSPSANYIGVYRG